jgi:glycerol-3-phosphate dehydrogenase
MPISYQVGLLLDGSITPKAALEALMGRESKPE